MTEVIIVKNEREAGDIYGRSVADLIKTKPNAVLGLATGSSPLAAYQSLARIVHSEHIDVSQVRGFALDEYLGLPLDHPQSYHSTIHRTVVEPLGLNPDLVHVPGDVLDGAPLSDGERIAAAGPAYDKAIEEAGGIDVQILGIGTDGHVGFNEPGSSFASGTRVKTLVEQTRIDNARFFDDDIDKVPTHCITQGIGTILKARHLVLLAFGSGKAEAVAETVEGGVSAFCPASALQMHPHATIIVDEEAASRLRHKDYYRYAYAHKPGLAAHLIAAPQSVSASVRILPLAGTFWTFFGLPAGGFLHSLEGFGQYRGYLAVQIPPLTGGIGTLRWLLAGGFLH